VVKFKLPQHGHDGFSFGFGSGADMEGGSSAVIVPLSSSSVAVIAFAVTVPGSFGSAGSSVQRFVLISYVMEHCGHLVLN
jgi:hypothetical protein